MASSDSNDVPAPPDDASQRTRRMSLRRKVSLKFKEFQGFVNEYSENVSAGGMFIRTPSPQPTGSVFDFEFTLGDDFTLIHGIGEVVWVREEDEGFDRPAGMGVRFLSLDPDSRKLIDRMVKERLDRQAAAPAAAPPGRPWDDPAPAAEVEPAAEAGPASEAEWDQGPPEPPAEPLPPFWADPPAAEAPAPAGSPSGGPSPYAYARSYQGSGVARRKRRARPLLVVLLLVALLVAALAAFFLFFPETAVRLLVGSEGGGDDRLAEVRRAPGEGEAPAGGPVEPVTRAEAGGLLAPPAGDLQPPARPGGPAAPEDGEEAAAESEGEEERELGFFAPAPPRPAPGPAPAPAPAPEPAAPIAAPETEAPSDFSRVLNVVWEELGEEVRVTVHLDGAIEEWDYSTARIEAAPPRELVRIEGITRPFPRTSIPVGTSLLEQIRVGFHPEARPSQLHVVLDLATPDAELARTEAEGSELRLYLARRDG